jgi:glycine cleavage system H protein
MSENFPDDVGYTPEHEWVRAGEGGVIRFGITHFAQDALGDIVFVTLPTVGAELRAGEACGEVESTKSVSDIFAPVTGVVVARNDAVETSPEILNTDPYGSGWIAEVQLPAGTVLGDLLDAAAYRASVEA